MGVRVGEHSDVGGVGDVGEEDVRFRFELEKGGAL